MPDLFSSVIDDKLSKSATLYRERVSVFHRSSNSMFNFRLTLDYVEMIQYLTMNLKMKKRCPLIKSVRPLEIILLTGF